ncbi:MAG TPA: DUF2905 domain-containing protein [bacterium]|nr:DUF2905 domain-containing protein [bacterium]
MGPHIGKFMIVAGITLLVLGVILTFAKNFPLGRLPGDIHIQRENFSFFFPVTTSIIISVILTLVFFFLGKR